MNRKILLSAAVLLSGVLVSVSGAELTGGKSGMFFQKGQYGPASFIGNQEPFQITDEMFKNPPLEFATQPIIHQWPENGDDMIQALKDYGCRGAVINCPFENGFTGNPENLKKLAAQMEALDKAGLKYWLYDEKGYPSGMAGGLTLEGHPELEAKGLYMRRIAAYEPRHIHFRIDCESDKIVHAAVYDLLPGQVLHEARIDFNSMRSVSFSKEELVIDLKPNETLYVFCVKRAHEGTQATHNTFSRLRVPNIMNKEAVRRFLEVAYEPIAKAIPDAYKRAEAVFTDEPSLMTSYARSYESWYHAMIPWTDGLFEKFEQEYGFPIFKKLPLLFEYGDAGYNIRYQFWRLVGKLIAESWSSQITEWCKKHGGIFSGHYLIEESIHGHIKSYGSYVEVLKHTGYPGIDILNCYPESFSCEKTTKHTQMALRKKNAHGMMVEICPFYNKEFFQKDALNNMTAVLSEAFLGGVRHVNSYFRPDFSKWRNGRLPIKGFTNQAESVWFNQYASRLRMMLTGLDNDCEVFVYYNLEDAQARMLPTVERYRDNPADWEVIECYSKITKTLYNAGVDFYLADEEDLVEGAEKSTISGHKVKVVIVPKPVMISIQSMKALLKMKKKGIKVCFVETLPQIFLGKENVDGEAMRAGLACCTQEEALAAARAADPAFQIETTAPRLPRAKYKTADGRELHFICNPNRTDAKIKVFRDGARSAVLMNPADGGIESVELKNEITVPAMRGIFLKF